MTKITTATAACFTLCFIAHKCVSQLTAWWPCMVWLWDNVMPVLAEAEMHGWSCCLFLGRAAAATTVPCHWLAVLSYDCVTWSAFCVDWQLQCLCECGLCQSCVISYDIIKWTQLRSISWYCHWIWILIPSSQFIIVHLDVKRPVLSGIKTTRPKWVGKGCTEWPPHSETELSHMTDRQTPHTLSILCISCIGCSLIKISNYGRSVKT